MGMRKTPHEQNEFYGVQQKAILNSIVNFDNRNAIGTGQLVN